MNLIQLKNSVINSLRQPLFMISLFTYLSTSLAFTVVAKTIVFYMSDMNFSLYHIALAGIFISIPQTYKALIVALIDYMPVPVIAKLGRSKSILIYFNISISVIILTISMIKVEHITWTLLLCFIGCAFGVCLDSINSGYFNNVSMDDDRTWMKGGNVGYNLGVFVALQLSAFLSKYYSWAVIYKWAVIFNVFLLPVLIFGPKCSKTRHVFGLIGENNGIDSKIGMVKKLTEPYRRPIMSLYSMHKAYLCLLGVFIAFYRAPDRILGHMLTKIKLDLFGKDMYLILQCVGGIATVVSPLVWSEIAKTHYKRLKIVNTVHTSVIMMLGVTVFLWKRFEYRSCVSVVEMVSISFSVDAGYIGWIAMCMAMILFVVIKFVRIVESSTCFAYHCDLCEKEYFQTQLAIISSVEQVCGKVLGVGVAYLTLFVSQPVLFIIIGATSAPAMLALEILKKRQRLLNKEDR